MNGASNEWYDSESPNSDTYYPFTSAISLVDPRQTRQPFVGWRYLLFISFWCSRVTESTFRRNQTFSAHLHFEIGLLGTPQEHRRNRNSGIGFFCTNVLYIRNLSGTMMARRRRIYDSTYHNIGTRRNDMRTTGPIAIKTKRIFNFVNFIYFFWTKSNSMDKFDDQRSPIWPEWMDVLRLLNRNNSHQKVDGQRWAYR